MTEDSADQKSEVKDQMSVAKRSSNLPQPATAYCEPTGVGRGHQDKAGTASGSLIVVSR